MGPTTKRHQSYILSTPIQWATGVPNSLDFITLYFLTNSLFTPNTFAENMKAFQFKEMS